MTRLATMGVGGLNSFVKSVQPFTITIGSSQTSNTATITAVDTNNSIILWGGWQTTATSAAQGFSRLTLTNSTTVTANRNTSATTSAIARGTVLELHPGSVAVAAQYGSITIGAGATSNTATITSVDTAKSALIFLGSTTTIATLTSSIPANVELTNSTTVTAARAGSTGTVVVNFCVVQLNDNVVRSAQHRTVTAATSATAPTDTITSVDTTSTLLFYNGVLTTLTTPSSFLYGLTLTNSTTVTLTRIGTSTTSRTIKYCVLEFQPGVLRTRQESTTSMTGVTSNTSTITSVDTSRAAMVFQGNQGSTVSSTAFNTWQASVSLTNSTTVTAARSSSTSNAIAHWATVEVI